jgi:hypothetical protein
LLELKGNIMNAEPTLTYHKPSLFARLRSRLEAWRHRNADGGLVQHAKREFLACGYPPIAECGPDPDKWIQENVLELLKVFGKQGHSGFSAPYCIQMFTKLANFEPLVPLKGTDDEWNEVSEGCWQNVRCSHVFKDLDVFDGQAYDMQGKVFREPSGSCYTSRDSRLPITFPYTPTTVYVNVSADGEEA